MKLHDWTGSPADSGKQTTHDTPIRLPVLQHRALRGGAASVIPFALGWARDTLAERSDFRTCPTSML
jgi:hypothetical protein